MAKRKTIAIEAIVNAANQTLAESVNEWREQRLAIHSFVEHLLMSVDAYRGFRYLTEQQVKPGLTFGIVFDDSSERKHTYPDNSRVAFY